MSRLNLKDASLLDVSGELSPAARQQLRQHLSQNPTAYAQYEAIHSQFSLLSHLPIPEPSAAERRKIPAQIKFAVQYELALQRKNQAVNRYSLIRRALGAGMALAACVAVCATAWNQARSQEQQQRTQMATINAVIDHASANSLTSAAADASPIFDGTNSFTKEYRVLAHLADPVNFPQDLDEWAPSDPSAPPGSY